MNEPSKSNVASMLTLAAAPVIPGLLPQLAHGMYDPKHGRWLQRDPLGVRPDAPKGRIKEQKQYRDGANLYEYARSQVTVGSDPWGLVIVVEDIGPCQALHHWRDGSGETVEIIGQNFLNDVKSMKEVKPHIPTTIQPTIEYELVKAAKEVEVGEAVEVHLEKKNLSFTMEGWRWGAFGTAYHDYSFHCAGTRHNWPAAGTPEPDHVDYRCLYHVNGHDRYHNFENNGWFTRATIYAFVHLGKFTWEYATKGPTPKPFDMQWQYSDTLTGVVEF